MTKQELLEKRLDAVGEVNRRAFPRRAGSQDIKRR